MKMPRTYHIEGSGLTARANDDDRVPFNKLKGQFLVIEEKVDGASVSIAFDRNLDPNAYHRGTNIFDGKWVHYDEYKQLYNWMYGNEDMLFDIIGTRYIIFGEWMYNKHCVYYDKLPFYFLESDIYDCEREIWLSTSARVNLLQNKIHSVPVIKSIIPNKMSDISDIHLGKSHYQSDNWIDNLKDSCNNHKYDFDLCMKETYGFMEGLYIKHEDADKVINRYKFINSKFIETIINSGTHIIDRPILANKLLL